MLYNNFTNNNERSVTLFEFDFVKNRDKIEKFENFVDSKKDMKGSLIALLQKAQEIFGYIPEPIVKIIEKKTDYLESEIFGVATFYSQFTLIPRGKYSISVCMGTACYVKGAQDILDDFKKELNIDVGGTTEDMLFSIVETRCVGLCALAPVVSINDKMYTHFKREDVKKVLKEIAEAEKNG